MKWIILVPHVYMLQQRENSGCTYGYRHRVRMSAIMKSLCDVYCIKHVGYHNNPVKEKLEDKYCSDP